MRTLIRASFIEELFVSFIAEGDCVCLINGWLCLWFLLASVGSLAGHQTQRSVSGGVYVGLLAPNTRSSHPPGTFTHTQTHQVKDPNRNTHI